MVLNDPLPLLPVPLLPADSDVILDLGVVLKAAYARIGYDWRIDYRRPMPPPELRSELADWLQQILPEANSSP